MYLGRLCKLEVNNLLTYTKQPTATKLGFFLYNTTVAKDLISQNMTKKVKENLLRELPLTLMGVSNRKKEASRQLKRSPL